MSTAPTAEPAGGGTTELLLRFARAAHGAGYPTAELEPLLLALGRALGLPAMQASVTPTAVTLTVGTIPTQRDFTLRVTPQPVDLEEISRLDRLAADLLDGRIEPGEAIARIGEIDAERLDRPTWLVVAAYGLAGSALSAVLGGGWRESLGAALAGLVVGLVSHFGSSDGRRDVLVVPLAALAASLTAAALVQAGLDAAPDRVALAALVVLLPGMTLTIGMRELATNHLQSGLANTAAALVRLLGLVFGVAAGVSLAERWFGSPARVPLDPFPEGIVLLAAVASGLAFVVTLRAPTRDVLWTCSAAFLAVGTDIVATEVLGDIAGVFAAALVVGLAGNTFARMLRRSPLVFIVPGILVLVPGSAGYESASDLLAGATVRGIDTAFTTFATALAIVYGLVVSAIVLPERRRAEE